MKTSTKRKAIVKETGIPPKKRGRPAGSKSKLHKLDRTNPWHPLFGWAASRTKKWNDSHLFPHNNEIDVPDMTQWQKGFDDGTVCGYESASSDMKLVNKITLVLTLVNVAILISLVIKNV